MLRVLLTLVVVCAIGGSGAVRWELTPGGAYDVSSSPSWGKDIEVSGRVYCGRNIVDTPKQVELWNVAEGGDQYGSSIEIKDYNINELSASFKGFNVDLKPYLKFYNHKCTHGGSNENTELRIPDIKGMTAGFKHTVTGIFAVLDGGEPQIVNSTNRIVAPQVAIFGRVRCHLNDTDQTLVGASVILQRNTTNGTLPTKLKEVLSQRDGYFYMQIYNTEITPEQLLSKEFKAEFEIHHTCDKSTVIKVDHRVMPEKLTIADYAVCPTYWIDIVLDDLPKA